jgi:hypothetical protein
VAGPSSPTTSRCFRRSRTTGDGSPATPWTFISDPDNLGVAHVYTDVIGQTFAATLSVRNASFPTDVATAAYPVVIKDGGTSLPAQLFSWGSAHQRQPATPGLAHSLKT